MDLQEEIARLTAQIAGLTERVYLLERGANAATSAPERAAPATPQQSAAPIPAAATPQPPGGQTDLGSRPYPPAPSAQPHLPMPQASASESISLEKQIGQNWLNRVGVVAMLVGVSYFLKYAFNNNWIGPAGRVAIGLLAGLGLIVWSERLRVHGHRVFSYSIKAVGIGTLYLSLWGAYQIYHLIPAGVAFAAMAVVTGATIVLALTQDAQVLAGFALIGGFATPVLLSTGQNHEIALFSYVALLDLAILAMTIAKPWRVLLWGSFAGTCLLYIGWYGDYYSSDQRALTVFYAALFAAIFAAIPLATRHDRSTRSSGPSITLTVIPLLNAALFFLALYVTYQGQSVTLTWYALILAAAYLGLSSLFKLRFPNEDTRFFNALHIGIAIVFITIAIPLKLTAEWITIGWLVESAVLLWIAVKMQIPFLRYLGSAALVLGIFRLLECDHYPAAILFLNPRFATYLVAIAVLAGVVKFGARYASEVEKPFLSAAAITMNLLALIALTWEALDYFHRQLAMVYQGTSSLSYSQLMLAWGFSYSAIWLVYGAALMAFGLWKRSAFVRWQALVLIAVTIGKVFFWDASQLQKGYRILSFVALGAVLLAISFIYQRDWLKLSPRSAQERSGKSS
jgi:uncharacterized membrane protein